MKNLQMNLGNYFDQLCSKKEQGNGVTVTGIIAAVFM